MDKVGQINNFPVYKLTKDIAQEFVKDLAEMANQIPLVDYTEKEILAEKKEDRIFYNKWDHSLIVFDKKRPIAFIFSYERKAEENNQYPENSLYICELAVSKKYQRKGIGKQLIKLFLELNKQFLHLNGRVIYSIQTNRAFSNKHVQDLYKSFGFKYQADKKYDNRTDMILVKK